MAKKALINPQEKRGQDFRGYRVVDVVEVGSEFEAHSSLQWKDCDDSVEIDMNWFDPVTNKFRLAPRAVDPVETAGALATDADGNKTEDYEWNWDTETWSKVQIINQ